jgi:electron transfer flavoprotein alpha subunit
MGNIGLLIEFEDGRVKASSIGMAAAALGQGRDLYALVVDAPIQAAKAVLPGHGVGCIVNITTGLTGGLWNPAVWTDAVVAAMEAYGIGTLIGITSPRSRELLPRIAARLDAPLLMDCTQIDLESQEAKTSWYSGKVIATIALKGLHRIYGLRANVIPSKAHPVEAQILDFEWRAGAEPNLEVMETRINEEGAQNLAEADIIISGGRGMKNGENFQLLFDCAKSVGAAVGASRVAVDNGWVPYAMQVGQTGVKVNPKVYLACGISGSVQHYAGMKTSQMIIAINSDENAAIISNCDYYAVGDLFEILPELAKALSEVQ